ncbi:XRE family transcriptional regulator [Chromobacterium sp. LK1]|uniref:XRE family transcriptional regulator n=1 Tax=Chromobacterium sp. LK1 TaxID=1628193 RepID=UPI00069FE1B1|nr:S24 family peptidase [Chromobacterium sp. LK1]
MRLIREEVLKEARNVTAQKLGISLVSLQNYEGGARQPSAVLVAKFSRLTGVRADWLLFGEGEALPGEAGRRTGEPPVSYAPDAHVEVPCYGAGAAVPLAQGWLASRLKLPAGQLAAVAVAGDAMAGVLNDGDLVLINRAETQPGSGLYALELDGEVVVRRAQRLPGGKLGLSSANEAYPPFEVDLAAPPGDFSVLGRVVWLGRQV